MTDAAQSTPGEAATAAGESTTDAEAARHAWENPGAFEVAPGIHRIPLPLPGDNLKAVNIYAISDGDQVVCIDGGWALEQAGPILAKGLASIGYELGDVREYLVTHMHRDHFTNAIAMRRLHGSKVSLGEGEKAALDLLKTIDYHPDVKRLAQAGATDMSRELKKMDFERDLTDWEDPDRWLPDGVDLPLDTRTLRVIATPGHTIGHVVFHDLENNALFAGDHVLPHITPSIGVELNRPPSPLRDYLSSLDLIRALPDAHLLPAHGPATESVHARIDELLLHHADRLDATQDKVRAGAHSGFEVARALGWTRRQRRFDDLDFFNRLLAVQETMAHLRVLAERGRIAEAMIDGRAQFTPC